MTFKRPSHLTVPNVLSQWKLCTGLSVVRDTNILGQWQLFTGLSVVHDTFLVPAFQQRSYRWFHFLSGIQNDFQVDNFDSEWSWPVFYLQLIVRGWLDSCYRPDNYLYLYRYIIVASLSVCGVVSVCQICWEYFMKFRLHGYTAIFKDFNRHCIGAGNFITREVMNRLLEFTRVNISLNASPEVGG